jgi:hypothetical protein
MDLSGVVNSVHNSFLHYSLPDLHGLLIFLLLLIGERRHSLVTFSTPLSNMLDSPSNLYGSHTTVG